MRAGTGDVPCDLRHADGNEFLDADGWVRGGAVGGSESRLPARRVVGSMEDLIEVPVLVQMDLDLLRGATNVYVTTARRGLF